MLEVENRRPWVNCNFPKSLETKETPKASKDGAMIGSRTDNYVLVSEDITSPAGGDSVQDWLQPFTQGLIDQPKEEDDAYSRTDYDFLDITPGDNYAHDSLNDLPVEKAPLSFAKAGDAEESPPPKNDNTKLVRRIYGSLFSTKHL